MKYLDLIFALTPPFIVLSATLAYFVRMKLRGRVRNARVDEYGSTVLLGKAPMEMGAWLIGWVVRPCVALGITPNQVTYGSLIFGIGAGVALATGWIGLGALLTALSSALDAADGGVARATNSSSDAGEVLDATVDRYNEMIFMAGATIYFFTIDSFWGVLVSMVAICGAFMVSYASAKAEALQVEAPRGAMRRAERALYCFLAAGIGPVVAIFWNNPMALGLPMICVFALIGGIGNISAVKRFGAIQRLVIERDRQRDDAGAAATVGAE
jgi:CDP-diacylglycerol---glycerol-3-phosphate 3-phosphatidyltransferase